MWFQSDEKSIEVNGTLSAGNYEISGEVSSQYTTGMLFALSRLSGKSTLKITGNAESRAYVDMTIKVLKDFGADIAEPEKNFFEINGKGRLPSSAGKGKTLQEYKALDSKTAPCRILPDHNIRTCWGNQ